MTKEFQNNCLLYTCKKDYRFFFLKASDILLEKYSMV